MPNRILMLSVVAVALAMPGAVVANVVPPVSVITMMPLTQIDPSRLAMARVTDADGQVIGAVQKVDVRDGRPVRLDVALLGTADTVSLDASTARYDAATNVVASGQSAAQLLAKPQK